MSAILCPTVIKAKAIAAALAADAERLSPDRPPLAIREIRPHAIVEVKVTWFIHPRLRKPDECEQAILEVLFRRGKLRTEQIARALADIYSRNTVRRRLYRLYRLGVLNRSVVAPRGYSIKE